MWWTPKNDTDAQLEAFLARRPLDRMERTLQDVAREEISRRKENWILQKVEDYANRPTETGNYPTDAQCDQYEAKLRSAG